MTVVLVEQEDEWQDGCSHFFEQSTAQLLADNPAPAHHPLLEDLAA
jgi:hypothetical protein